MACSEASLAGVLPRHHDVIPEQPNFLPGNQDVLPGNQDVLPGNQYVLPGNHEVLPGNHEVLLGNQYVLPGNHEVLPGNHEVLPGNHKILPGNHEVLPGNHEVLPGNHEVLPGNHEILPGNHEVLLGNHDVLPGNHDVLPGNHEVLPGNHDVLPGNHEVLPGNHEVLPGNHEVLPGNHEVLPGNQDVLPGNQDVLSGHKAALPGKHDVLVPQPPQVSEASLREALMHDQGQDARLHSWTRHNFTKKGDNYIADITSVNTKFYQSGREREVSYVVKMKHNKRKGCINDFDDMVFNKEGKFYTELLPLINHELTSVGMAPLRVPRCLHANWNAKQNQLFLEDLRTLGFKLHDRKKPLSVPHAALVLRELARLHAASVLFLSKISKEDLKNKFKFLMWEMYNYSEQTKKAYDVLICGSLQTASELARAAGSDDMHKWFGTLSLQGAEVLIRQIGESSAFDVIGHGDCWINNFLFRYDAAGQPVEVMLLDFQMCHKTSLAFDLNYFLFSSLAPAEKNARLDELIVTYYTSFSEVTRAAGVPMPYTVDDITNEFYKRNMVGLIFGALAIPALVCDPQDAQDFDVASAEHSQNYVNQKRQTALSMLEKNPLMSSRLASLYKDVRIYAGLAQNILRTSF